MKKLLLLLLLLLPLNTEAARLFVASNGDKIDLATVGQPITDKLSFSVWFKVAALPGAAVNRFFFFKSKASDVTDVNYWIDLENSGSNRIRIVWTSSVGNFVVYKSGQNLDTLTLNTWHHWAWTVDWTTNPDAVIGYLDGTAATPTLASGGNNTTPTTGGTQAMEIGHFVGTGIWNGDLADVAACNCIFAPNEITALANRQRPNKLGHPLLYYLSLDGSLTAEPDYSGNGCTGTVTGATRSNNPPLVPF
jgi:Concanavalin A-like lectin/glucanases superfamily